MKIIVIAEKCFAWPKGSILDMPEDQARMLIWQSQVEKYDGDGPVTTIDHITNPCVAAEQEVQAEPAPAKAKTQKKAKRKPRRTRNNKAVFDPDNK